jgi:predicted acetyltransferase
MAYAVRPVRDLEEFRVALARGLGHYAGWEPTEDDAARFAVNMPLERMYAVFDGPEVVAAAGVWPVELTIPGGPVPCAAPTLVGVLPTHRRRGFLRRLMDAQLRDAREREEPLSALWASEETIYGRFGYGLASLCARMRLDTRFASLRDGSPPREGAVRLIGKEEALRVLPPLYERLRVRSPGFISRSRAWWERRVLHDGETSRRGAGPLHCALLELGGRPAGWALYRVRSEVGDDLPGHTLLVQEAFGVDDLSTLEIWRFLLELDWMEMVETWDLPLDHPLLLRIARLNELRLRVLDGLWVRLLDVDAALRGRSYEGDGRVTLEVVGDPHFRDNVGVWSVGGGEARRMRGARRPDLRVPVQSLGSVFLGGFSFGQLARAGLVEEVRRGGAQRADALFRTPTAPWCPESF